ncbi:hypothetical protein AVEN_94229-1 [Araneus ventricosus]|uniref:Mos1 transposase HTH domain-containing protein n=1 Tax=Araneus ventricosus TaxID=182803 RepID=A0A4Y2SWD3_ARAVE|nr:hypothetical protein AVEN_94229-1 [Araneus ventricosus]
MAARMCLIREEEGDHLSEDLMLVMIDEKVRENRRFTISSLSNAFPQVSRRVLYGIVTERLNYCKAADFYEDGIQKLFVGYEKYLNIGGNYIEK